jgi:hypothetical protein
MSCYGFLRNESAPILGVIMRPHDYEPGDFPDQYGNPRTWGELSEAEQEQALKQIRQRRIGTTLEDTIKSFFRPAGTTVLPGEPDNKIFGLDPKVAIGGAAAIVLLLFLLMRR